MIDLTEFTCASIAVVLGVPAGKVTPEYVIESSLWDASSAIEIASRIKSTFGIRLTSDFAQTLIETNRVENAIRLVNAAVLSGSSGHDGTAFPKDWADDHTDRHVVKPCHDLYFLYRDGSRHMTFELARFLRQTRIPERNYAAYADVTNANYAMGISATMPSFGEFLSWQQWQREHCFPHTDRLFCMGSMSGALAAILSGHYLKAEIVWSFGLLTTELMQTQGRYSTMQSEIQFDHLKELMQQHNGVTEYRLYFNNRHARGRLAAESLAACPGVHLYPQDGNGPFVIADMVRAGELEGMLPVPEQIGGSEGVVGSRA